VDLFRFLLGPLSFNRDESPLSEKLTALVLRFTADWEMTVR